MNLLAAVVLTLLAPTGKRVESSVAVSHGRAVIAAINTAVPGEIEVFASADNAQTWSAPMAMPTAIGGKTYRFAGDPTLAVLDDGSFGLAYFVELMVPPRIEEEALVFVRSSDGIAWSEPVVIASGTAPVGVVIDKPWLSVDRLRGTAYLVWSRAAEAFAQEIVFARSSDRGVTWSAPVAVTPAGGETYGQIGVVADGAVVMADFDATTQTCVSRVSQNGGATFGPSQLIGAGLGTGGVTGGTKTFSQPAPMLAAFRGDLYCAYSATAGVFIASSHDGTTWSTPLQLGGANGDALLPSVAVEETTGDVVVVWLDGRDDPDHRTLRVYAARSTDGGGTFDTPRPLSPPFPAGGFLGDYNCTTSLGNGVYLTAFSSAGGFLSALRFEVPPSSRHRAVNH